MLARATVGIWYYDPGKFQCPAIQSASAQSLQDQWLVFNEPDVTVCEMGSDKR